MLASHPSYPSATRTALAREVCKEFGSYLYSNRRVTHLQHITGVGGTGGESKIKLPPGISRPDRPNARLLDSPVPPPTEVPTPLDAVKGLRIERVQTRVGLALWNTLMAEEHPQCVFKPSCIRTVNEPQLHIW